MTGADIRDAARPDPDRLLTEIADYVLTYPAEDGHAREIARYCLMDSLGCGMLALGYPECTKLLGPVVPGATLSPGARVPGTSFELDPVMAAFNIGALVRGRGPPSLRGRAGLLRRCLEKDASRRFQSVSDLAFTLSQSSDHASAVKPTP